MRGVIVEIKGKICSECRRYKLAEDYYTNDSHKDGLTSQCKTCTKEKSKAYMRIKRQKQNRKNNEVNY